MAIDRADIAIRMVEERARIGYSQADFARKLGISRETQRRYEIGESGLSGEMLAHAALFGVDVQYVLTGIRSLNAQAAQQAVMEQGSDALTTISRDALTMPNGTTVNIVTTQHVTHVKALVKPGTDHISEAQAAQLTALVNEIVELETRLQKEPKGYRAVWGALNAHCRVTRYRLIAAVDYDKADTYLRQWLLRLNSLASSPRKENERWRTRKLAYIKINTQQDAAWLGAFLYKHFKSESLTDLSDKALEKTYRAVASRRRKVSSAK
ncbi:transcriptional regulator with XRE-family HTH domain [Chitinivorax tropicus]|uniref:Transcriptional regulator with XRE-family HTH domain n=1 Tax=Chitinivorax tropicus TaxID=714531 RepID=A0A840MKM6_9PROT|nr:transcriptional regulator [Chitinivorax tropicus]MBB5017407.1 transcriptional regulator with XRE-family HTH domain [Chitinivorax tropicus]